MCKKYCEDFTGVKERKYVFVSNVEGTPRIFLNIDVASFFFLRPHLTQNSVHFFSSNVTLRSHIFHNSVFNIFKLNPKIRWFLAHLS